MRILVAGGGVIGVTAAWYLAGDGHDVTLVDRQSGPARETSFANGGQISAAHAAPWANPAAPAKILKWLGREDAPLLFRLRADWRQWRWGLAFLRECSPARTRENTLQCLRLALYSRDCLQALRVETAIDYEHQERGILEFHTDAGEFEHEAHTAQSLREQGVDRALLDAQACVALEPALAQCRERLCGGVYSASDESGDAHGFTVALAELAAARGVKFRYGTSVQRLVAGGDALAGVDVAMPTGDQERVTADAYVVALGSYSPLLLAPLHVPCEVYPVKGYSVTFEVRAHQGAPSSSLTDAASKIVMTRLGDRLRVAGTAELTGWDTSLNAVRCQALARRTFDLFPDAGARDTAQWWSGLRPATPSNVPLIGRTRYRNLWLDTGHGTLGFTMACGSGRALADLIAKRRPDVDFAFTKA